MKKMSNSKRGFTLTEILIVTAIVVIVSAAAFTGVAITLSRARETQKNLKENNGDNFENAARSEVDAINKDAADFAEIPSYKPKDSEATEESSDESSDESTNGGGDVDPKTTPTPLPTNTPTPKPSETSATTTAHNSGGGGIQSGVLASSTSTNQISFNGYKEDVLDFDSSVKNANTVTVTYKFSGADVTDCKNWGHLGSGAPTVTIENNTVTLVFNVGSMEGWQKDNMMKNKPQFHSSGQTQIQIESVSTT